MNDCRRTLRLGAVVAVIGLGLVLSRAGSFAAAEEKPPMSPRPNIVLILADDLGYGELGCYGQKEIATPQLDRMAQQGMRFTQFYAGATVCAPSRSVLMTGKHHGHTRVRGNAGAQNPAAQALQAGDVTVAGVLKQAGYRTALIGKWGLGDVGRADTGLPRKHGFDSFYGFLNQRHAHNHYPDFLWDNEDRVALQNKVVPVGGDGAGYATEAVQYADDLFADRAIAFVREKREEPFFLFWSMVVPHANNERSNVLKNGAEVPDFGPYASKDWPEPDKGQAAMITRLDGYVGRMLDALRAAGLAENTLVIFTSDNGPHNESRHDLARFQPSGPLRGIKRSLTDGGIRVPLIAWRPGSVPAGATNDYVGYFGDFLATFAELAGAKAPDGGDSLSLMPTLAGRFGAQPKHEFLYWEFHEGGFKQAALFEGRWKGIRSGGRAAPLVLYDLRNDIGEATDVAAEHPEIVKRIDSYLATARSPSADWEPRWSVERKSPK
jgi:arylsulfatase A-like enzyme